MDGGPPPKKKKNKEKKRAAARQASVGGAAVLMSSYWSVCKNVLLDHRRNRNETFRVVGINHPLDGYYILKTYCYYVSFKVICEKNFHLA